ncbi:hypothetical protein BDV95DRAFT_619552 [Massariosphaeria phaeospora]|uniref:Uncharacterized protein n=1 Tax=Massariosphaeria phaeospora TaxID=100035 RepID=A0A7C8M749_9PLEO|nr:hypothetical protein BDV95DRAFT_619552 [Massariosphaeria phaeospora]
MGGLQTIMGQTGFGIPGAPDFRETADETINFDEAVEFANEESESIFTRWKTLTSILERYEDTIRKRWGKKTREQRKKLLLQSWPDIILYHRPDLRHYRRKTAVGESDQKTQTAYRWPHINLEDLSDSTNLLLFLNSRGRHAPAVFAPMDCDSISLGISTGAIPQEFPDTFSHMNLESVLLEEYGRLMACPVTSGVSDNAAEGLMVLKTQHATMGFLVDICERILHDKKTDDESLKLVPVLPEPPILSSREGEWVYATDLTRESPYLVPHKLDLRRVQSLIQARLTEWEDYAWAMREDPSFMAEVVGDWSEHSSERVMTRARKEHPDLVNPLRKKNFWDRTIASTINEPYENLTEFIDGQYEQPQNVPGLTTSITRIKFLLEVRLIEKVQRELGFIFPSSPPVRALFMTEGQGGLQLRSDLNKDDQLLWLVGELMNKESEVPKDIIATELNNLVHTDKSQKARITPMVARFIGDISLGYELRSQLRLLCPLLYRQDDQNNPYEKILEVENPSLIELLRPLYDLKMIVSPAHAGSKFLKLGDLGNPAMFYYPVDKRRTQDNVEAMQTAERNLDALWAKYDGHLRTHLSAETNDVLQAIIPDRGELQRTPDWVEPQKVAQKPKTDVPVQPATFTDDNNSKDLPFSPPPPKTKVKTRGPAPLEDDGHDDAHPTAANEAPPPPPPRLFPVKKRTAQVFSTLFHTPTPTTQPGEIAWTDFVSALSAIGFQPEKLYGSVWRFALKDRATFGVDNAINFHEPHPQGKLPFRAARRYGRRLGRMYGLGGGSFVLEG